MEAAAIPFPSEETTPPVTKIYLAMANHPPPIEVSQLKPPKSFTAEAGPQGQRAPRRREKPDLGILRPRLAPPPDLRRSLSSNRQNRSPPRRARKGSGRPDAERSPILEFCALGSLRALSGFPEQPSSNTSRFLLPGFERRASRGRKDGFPSKLGVSASRRYIQKRVTFAHPVGHTPP